MKNGLGLMFKSVLATLMLSLIMIASPITANAAISSENQDYVVENWDTLGSNIQNKFKETADGMTDPQTITVGTKTYYYDNIDSKKIDGVIENLIDTRKATDKIESITDDTKIEADTKKASEALSGVTPIISGFLGGAVILITLGMTVFSAIDIVYIVFPATRNFLENANSKTKIQIVTDDAMVAIKQSSIESGKTPMGTYFARRVVSYIILSVMLFIILTGNISLITNLALRVVSGLLEILVTI